MQDTGLLTLLKEAKGAVLSEPSRTDEFDKTMHGFYNAIRKQRGALLIAIFRGKASLCCLCGCGFQTAKHCVLGCHVVNPAYSSAAFDPDGMRSGQV